MGRTGHANDNLRESERSGWAFPRKKSQAERNAEKPVEIR